MEGFHLLINFKHIETYKKPNVPLDLLREQYDKDHGPRR